MYNLIKEYKELSSRIITEIKGEGNSEVISDLLDERQKILDKATNNNQLQRFRIQYAQSGLDKVDEEMRSLLCELLEKTKEEMRVHRKKQNATNAYMKTNKPTGNIFTIES